MRKSIKRVLSVALAATVAVSGVAYTGTKASAASSYKAVMGIPNGTGMVVMILLRIPTRLQFL